jgi:hypothetical protein
MNGQSESPVPRAVGHTNASTISRYTHVRETEVLRDSSPSAIRPLGLGRKNWLFAGSDAGGGRAAVFYTLIRSAKMNGVEPGAYLREVLTRIGEHPIAIDALLPWSIFRPAQRRCLEPRPVKPPMPHPPRHTYGKTELSFELSGWQSMAT